MLRDRDCPFDGFWVPSRNYFFGRWIRYGIAYNTEGINKTIPGHGYRKTLWKRGMAWYPDRCEHEDLEVKGRWGYLMGHYDHFSHESVSQWIRKMNFYTDVNVARLPMDDPMYKPYRPLKTALAVLLCFWDQYVARKGYRDGMFGFMVAGLNALYIFVERCKMWERAWKEQQASLEQPAAGGRKP